MLLQGRIQGLLQTDQSLGQVENQTLVLVDTLLRAVGK